MISLSGAALVYWSGKGRAMNEREPSQQTRIEIAPGIFVVADKRAGERWIEAWHVLNTALKRCKTDSHPTGETQDVDDHDQQPG